MSFDKKETFKMIRDNVNETDPYAEFIIYGSRARGDEHTESVWDILILTDYAVSLNKQKEFRHNLYDLELEIEEPFSTFVYSKKRLEYQNECHFFFH